MDIPEMKKLISQMVGYMGRHGLQKLKVKAGDIELELEKPSAFSFSSMPMMQAPVAAPIHQVASENALASSPKNASTEVVKGHLVTSPIVGTFYSSSNPASPAFVKIGDRVDESTIICIVEAMKVMNEIRAGKAGVVEEIYVENGHPVEFGTKIMRIV